MSFQENKISCSPGGLNILLPIHFTLFLTEVAPTISYFSWLPPHWVSRFPPSLYLTSTGFWPSLLRAELERCISLVPINHRQYMYMYMYYYTCTVSIHSDKSMLEGTSNTDLWRVRCMFSKHSCRGEISGCLK